MKTNVFHGVKMEDSSNFWETFYSSPASFLKEAISLKIDNPIFYPDQHEDDRCTVEVALSGYNVDSCYKAVAAAESLINGLNSISRKTFSLNTWFTAYGCLGISIKESETLKPENESPENINLTN
ncbi:MAG: hypothetical protein LBG96_16620 [Tannerella sp.]|jgi:hypothetical protein|nr:hypothetical protein [Tannerella sp.]